MSPVAEWRASVRRTLNTLLNIALPAECAGCGERLRTTEDAVCGACLNRTLAPRMPLCPQCGLGDRMAKGRCPGCLPGESPWDIARQATLWAEPIPTLIHALKYHALTEVARPLAALLAKTVEMEMGPEPWDLVTPVPLHRARQSERGFNQSALIAKSLAASLDIPFAPHAVIRHRATQTQTHLSRAERLENVEGAFTCQSPAQVEGKRVLLVDDVHTSGATMRAAALALRQSGAREIGTCAVARAAM